MLKEALRGKRLSPTQKRQTVKRLRDKFSVSERRACRGVDFLDAASDINVEYETTNR